MKNFIYTNKKGDRLVCFFAKDEKVADRIFERIVKKPDKWLLDKVVEEEDMLDDEFPEEEDIEIDDNVANAERGKLVVFVWDWN